MNAALRTFRGLRERNTSVTGNPLARNTLIICKFYSEVKLSCTQFGSHFIYARPGKPIQLCAQFFA